MSWTTALVLAGSVLTLGSAVILADARYRTVGDNSGYEPEQPIHFSHRLHAGELGMDCLACHYGAERSRHAGIPSASLCMGCHLHVTAAYDVMSAERSAALAEGREPQRIVSVELRKLYDALALDDELLPRADALPRPIEWVRVHDLPDHVEFDHRVHVARGLACQQCHGPVQTMERVRQEATLSMGWCLDCHRSSPRTPGDTATPATHVPTDCARCHY